MTEPVLAGWVLFCFRRQNEKTLDGSADVDAAQLHQHADVGNGEHGGMDGDGEAGAANRYPRV